jgi:hypothetical protein
MLRSSSSSPVEPSVKLFPRLATPQIASNVGIYDRPVGSRESDLKRVRARLLKMILDNERTRRNNRPPSAS